MNNFSFVAELNNSLTAQHIVTKLPVEAVVSRWGDELYFNFHEVPGVFGQTREVNIGDVAFWPEGRCLCVFFGRTPASVVEKPVAENPVVVVGRTLATPDELRVIREGEKISVSVAEQLAAGGAPAQPEKDRYGERKLSQGEIDNLVQRLLRDMEEKKRQIRERQKEHP